MPRLFGRVPVETKMRAANGKVGRHGQIFVCPGTQNGAIVADAEGNLAGRPAGCPFTNMAQDRQLAPRAAW